MKQTQVIIINDGTKEVIKEVSKKIGNDEIISAINQPNKVKAIYKAEVFKYENGKTDILYECDKENNKECSKESCTRYNYCTHTLNKKYAKNFIKENLKLK